MDQEQRVRERAHQIWEEEGCPDGRAKEHWARACRELGVKPNSDGPGISVVAGEGAGGPNQGPSPVSVLAGEQAQEEPPYAGTDPHSEHSG